MKRVNIVFLSLIVIMTMIIISLLIVVLKCCDFPEQAQENNSNCQPFASDEKQSYCQVYQFDLDEWKDILPDFSVKSNVGKITNPFTVIDEAEKLWQDELQIPKNTFQEKVVYYDVKNRLWLVHGTQEDSIGTIPIAIIEEDGDVLAVWID